MGLAGQLSRIPSALVRPLDPRYPTNLVVLVLIPVTALAAGAWTLWQGHDLAAALQFALRSSLTVFVGWALARELAPDDNPAAFACLGLALFTSLILPSASLLLVYATLMLARIVNRSVGIPATLPDAIAILVLVGWTGYDMRSAGPGLVAAVAFGLDAMLPGGRRLQRLFVGLCLGLALVTLLTPGEAPPEAGASRTHWFLAAGIALLYAATITGTMAVRAPADRTGSPLLLSRQRGAMAIGLGMALQSFFGREGILQAALLWAVLAGLGLAFLVRQAGSSRRDILRT